MKYNLGVVLAAGLVVSSISQADTNITVSVSIMTAPTPDGPWQEDWWVEFPQFNLEHTNQFYKVVTIITNVATAHPESWGVLTNTPTNPTNRLMRP